MPIMRTTVRHDGTFVGGPGYNIWHLRVRDGFAATDLETMQDNLFDFYAAIRDLFPAASTHTLTGEWIDVQTGDFEQTDVQTVTGGSASAVYLPSQTCIVAGWLTSVRTRSGRGRTFLGPTAANTAQENGTPTEAARATIQSAGEGLIAAQSGVAQDFGAFGVWSPTQQVIRDFTACSVRNVFAHLTSRRV